jgi:hypothetical protein
MKADLQASVSATRRRYRLKLFTVAEIIYAITYEAAELHGSYCGQLETNSLHTDETNVEKVEKFVP